MSMFDIIGPIMIGPSSSHTAGAARIGRMAVIFFRKNRKKPILPYTDRLLKRIEGTARIEP